MLTAEIDFDAFAREIAAETARSAIECHTLEVDRDGLPWRDLDSAEEMAAEFIEVGQEYLEARGLLERHAANPRLVRLW